MRRIATYLLFLLVTYFGQAQTQGFAYNFDGTNTYARLGEILKNAQTIEFWIKPNQDINQNTTVQPILVRDKDGMALISNEEFALFFEGSQSTNSGKLAFRVGNGIASATIYSNQNFWNSKVWYHIAVSISPGQGLTMHVNGTKQTDNSNTINSIYFRNEGTTGELLLGRWDFVENDYLNAQLENLRFWGSTKSTIEIRNNMCRQVLSGPAYYFLFNSKLTNTLLVIGQGINPILVNGNISDYKKSNAPFGLSSTHLYDIDFTGLELKMSKLYSIKIDSINSAAKGVHIYEFVDLTTPLGIFNRGQFGVWFTDINARYNATFNYDNLSAVCDSCSNLSSRDDNLSGTWQDRNAARQGCNFILSGESTIGKSYREEYKLLDTLIIETGLGDSVSFCSLDSKFLSPNKYPNATYVWNDTNRTQNLLVNTPGYNTLDLYWKGCHVKKQVWVDFKPTPIFNLPKDTTICEGDTLWLTAPIDSAKYLWIGFFTERSFGITAPGTYNLKITVGDCFYRDEIKVDVIKNFNVDLGPDTTLCLGQGINFAFSGNGINYDWNDGLTSPYRQIFNAPGTYWVRAYNSCFEKFDTVNIAYEECECRIFVANSFTPNADNINDVFKPVSGCYYEEFELEILNRWGDIIFSTTNLDQGWDGNVSGKPAQMGMYNWRLRYKKYTWHKLSNYDYGQVILIR